MAYYFFTEPEKLLVAQPQNNAYGPINENEFSLTNLFNASSTTKAFALTSGNILVQQTTANSDLVNIVLKPHEQPDLDLPKLNYVIYKGVLKSSIIDTVGAIANRANNDLTSKIWQSFDLQKAAFDDSNSTFPDSPQAKDVLGFDYSTSGTGTLLASNDTPLDTAFYSDDKTLFFVSGGDYIGDFQSIEFGITISLEKLGYSESFKLAREVNSKLSFSTLAPAVTDADIFQRRHDKEAALSFIDSAAFFGAFIKQGINTYIGTGFTLLSGQELYDNVISKHYNKNRVYFDFRNEYHDSINYYKNFGDSFQWSLDNTDTLLPVDYYRNGWPLLVLDNTEIAVTNIDKIVKLSLPITANANTLVYLKRFFRQDIGLDDLPEGSDKFVGLEEDVNETGFAKLTYDLILPKHGTSIVSNYFQLKYLTRIAEVADTTPLVFKISYLDNLFPIFDMNIPFKQNTEKSYFKLFYDNSYIDKNLINVSDFTTNIGIAKDSQLTTFMAFPNNYNDNAQQNTDNTIPVSGMEGASGSLFLNQLVQNANAVQMVKGNLLIGGVTRDYLKFGTNDAVTQQINSNYTFDDVVLITLTNDQFSTIKALKQTEFPNNFKVYLGIDNIIENTDGLGTPYTTFNYILKGIKNEDGVIIQHTVDTAIEAITNLKLKGAKYTLNFEEKLGQDDAHKKDGKYYQDYFIDLVANIKTVVDDFKLKINAVDINQPSAYDRFTAITQASFASLWNAAKSYVQANASNPDDRPLYWARLKMQALLKQLAFFSYSIINNNIVVGSRLDKLITLSDELSRNYTNVSFTAAPAGAKKILVTGFDPFLLNQWGNSGYNILQSNPSGCCALSLSDTATANGLGFIQTLIAPVRYRDFDGSNNATQGSGEGIIEQYIQPWISEVDMIITISQSLPGDYNIDKYSTSRRGGLNDNLNYVRPDNSHCIPMEDNDALEWIGTTLPDSFIVPPVKYDWKYKDKDGVTVTNADTDENARPNPGDILKEGSGSNYLSNEIFYRVARLRATLRSDLPTGHFHISKIQNGQEDFDGLSTQSLVSIVKEAINNGVTGL